MSPEDNFGELTSLRPVLDSRGEPVMSSGNFAVVFKMRDEKTGKLYAVKCFTRPQEGRAESYRRITEELESVASAYMVPMRWLDNELFVDTTQCDREEFPVVVMEWVEGEPLDLYVSRHLGDSDALSMLSYRFNRMVAWLLAQPFAHGDLKPDNILVREDGSPVLVDYDGMFVPSMQGQKAREAGSPDYRHPLRTNADFNEHIDDFSLSVIALSLKALALNPALKNSTPADTLLLSEADFRNPANSRLLKSIALLTTDPDLTLLLGVFYITLAKKSLDSVSFRLFMTQKPIQVLQILKLKNVQQHDTLNTTSTKQETKSNSEVTHKIDTSVTRKDITEGIIDKYQVIYSKDGKRLLRCNHNLTEYTINNRTKIIGDSAFSGVHYHPKLQSINIPDSVIAIGKEAFFCCTALQSINIPDSVITIGERAFECCVALQNINIPNSVITIEEGMFLGCTALQSINIPDSVTAIGKWAFSYCKALQRINIPDSVTTIGDRAFIDCRALQSINIPDSVTTILGNPFVNCKNVQINLPYHSHFKIVDNLLISNSGKLISCLNTAPVINIPNSVTTIGDLAFFGCETLQSINIPSSVTTIGEDAFPSNCRINRV